MIIENVKLICKLQGITLTDLAQKLNIQRKPLYMTLKKDGIRLTTLQKIASALNCNVVDLIDAQNYTLANDPASKTQLHDNATINNHVFKCPFCNAKLQVCKVDDN